MTPAETTAKRRVRRVQNRRRAVSLGKALALLVAALPGAYGALKGSVSADERVVAAERRVRDLQEAAIQAHVKSLRVEIDALRRSAVSHAELLDLVAKLRPHRSTRSEPSEREVSLEREIAELKAKQILATASSEAADAVQVRLPALRPAPVARAGTAAE